MIVYYILLFQHLSCGSPQTFDFGLKFLYAVGCL
jgi:hypothetical protein